MDRTSAAELTINQLKRATIRTVSMNEKTVVRLSSAVVDHDIVNKSLVNAHVDGELNSFGGELVAFAIIEKAYAPLNGNVKTEYTMAATVNSNFVFFPRIYDSFAKAIESRADEVPRKMPRKPTPTIYGRINRHFRTPRGQPTIQYSPQAVAEEAEVGTPLEELWESIKRIYQRVTPFLAPALSVAKSMMMASP